MLKVTDSRGWTPIHKLIIEKSTKALQVILSPMSHDERLKVINLESAQTDVQIDHFFDWLKNKRKIILW